jgi:hypothetical protein
MSPTKSLTTHFDAFLDEAISHGVVTKAFFSEGQFTFSPDNEPTGELTLIDAAKLSTEITNLGESEFHAVQREIRRVSLPAQPFNDDQIARGFVYVHNYAKPAEEVGAHQSSPLDLFEWIIETEAHEVWMYAIAMLFERFVSQAK